MTSLDCVRVKPSPPRHLRCEFLVNPLGLNASAPRFSWISEREGRGARQTAYQVILSPELGFVEKEVGDYWDSGRVESEDILKVTYAGEPLWSGKRYHWRVRWWDEQGTASPYSEAAFFEMGLLRERDWRAKWISRREAAEFASPGNVLLGEYSGELVQSLGLYFRRDFTLKGKIRRARAYICGLGCSELYLNGRKVGDRVLDPAQTDYRKVALYSTYDITDLIGERNAVAVVLGNSRHIKNYGYGQPKLILEIHCELENELVDRIVTDETWKVSTGPLLENGIYSGERFDARLEQPGWDEPGFDDSAWENAAVVVPSTLSPQVLPPIRVTDKLKPERVWNVQPGTVIVDFGQNFSGWVRLRVRGCRGKEIKLRHAELVHEDGTLNVAPNQNAEATDVFVLKGEGEEVYEPRFTYHGFRFVEISGVAGDLLPEDVEGRFVHTDVERTGDFHCSNELLGRIHKNIIWGQLSNLMGIPTDCPQRDERHGWLGDAHLSAEEAILNFDMAAFYAKYLEDIRLAQREDGNIPDVVPPYLERLYPADPAWGMAYLELAWNMHFYYGDEWVLQRHYAAMKKYVDFLSRNAEDFIIKKLGKYGDWCPPGSVTPVKTPLELTSTWSYYRCVALLARFSALLGRTDDWRAYSRLADDVKTAFNAEFLSNGEYAAIKTSPVDKSPSQTSQVLPLALGIVPEEQKKAVLAKLLYSIIKEWDDHLATGIIGTKYLLDVLTENGHGDIAYRIVTQKSYPGWGYMVQEGATTLWERWEKLTGGGMNSHNHIMFGAVDVWFYQTLAGLRCQESGWKRITVRPPLFTDLSHASACLKTGRGETRVSWQDDEQTFSLDVTIPVGSEAEIYIPFLGGNSSVIEGGTVIWEDGDIKGSVEGLSFKKRENPYLILLAGQGDYHFVSQKK